MIGVRSGVPVWARGSLSVSRSAPVSIGMSSVDPVAGAAAVEPVAEGEAVADAAGGEVGAVDGAQSDPASGPPTPP